MTNDFCKGTGKGIGNLRAQQKFKVYMLHHMLMYANM